MVAKGGGMETTVATVNAKGDQITLRIRFQDNNVVNITETHRGIRVTTSSPDLLTQFKIKGLVFDAFNALKRIGDANLPDETINTKMERFRDMAKASSDIVDFARNTGLIEGTRDEFHRDA